jgi:uncharacterized integral membrane protein
MFRRLFQVLLFALLALLCAGFVRMNRTPTEIDLYFLMLPASVGEALVAAVLAGWLAGLLGALAFMQGLLRERAVLRRALKLAEGEARTLRSLAPSHAR